MADRRIADIPIGSGRNYVCVLLVLQDLLQSCSRERGGTEEDMCYERRRAEACVY